MVHLHREHPAAAAAEGARRVLPHVGDEFAVSWCLLLVASVALAKVARRRWRVLPAAEAAASGAPCPPRFTTRQVLGAAVFVCAALASWRVQYDFAARTPNLFTVLGVGGNTNNTRLIRKAYVGDGPDFSSPERSAVRTFAFKILSDHHRRYAYDHFGEPDPSGDGFAQPDFFGALAFYAWWGTALFCIVGLRRSTARAVAWCSYILFAVLALDFAIFVGWWRLHGVLGLPWLNNVRRLHRMGWARAACATTFENMLRVRHCVFPAIACFASFAAGFLWDDTQGQRQETIEHLRAMTHASAGTMVAIGGMVGEMIPEGPAQGHDESLAAQGKQCVCMRCLVEVWMMTPEQARARHAAAKDDEASKAAAKKTD